eukprot:1107273-Amorphochlora_amoeboformis.AAC.1
MVITSLAMKRGGGDVIPNPNVAVCRLRLNGDTNTIDGLNSRIPTSSAHMLCLHTYIYYMPSLCTYI